MQNLNNPAQMTLFDPWSQRFSPRLYEKLCAGWQGLFHETLLSLMPAEELAKHFHPQWGRPTKELYSVAGLIFLKACNNWTMEQAVDAYCFRLDVQYALNVSGNDAELSLRSLERYTQLFRDMDLANQVFDTVTKTLIGRMELNLSEQRLDSTHVYSNMAMIGRTSLMVQAVKRLLTQVRRHHRERYDALPDDFRTRYEDTGTGAPFGWGRSKADTEGRRRIRQQVADDMHFVLAFYDSEASITHKDTYKQLLRVFEEHCELIEETVQVRPKSDSRSLQSLTDLDVTYDGHKGRGFKAQVVETCSDENPHQLITDVLPQTAADSDSAALAEMVERLEDKDRKPDTLLTDTAYGSDENTERCADKDVELVAPAQKRSEKNRDKLTAVDFEIDDATNEVTRCPEGHTPRVAHFDPKSGEGFALFASTACTTCARLANCLVHPYRDDYRLKYSERSQRLDRRRRDQETPEFQTRYRKRAGVEGLMSALKRGYGFGRLRVRGMTAVRMELYLKAAGYNLKQAAKWMRGQAKQGGQRAQSSIEHRFWRHWKSPRRIRSEKFALTLENRDSTSATPLENVTLPLELLNVEMVLAG